jgi:heme A synthase
VSIVASVFAILSVLAAWKAQAAANKANDWAYLSYNASVVQIRLAVMQLCVDNPVSSRNSIYISLMGTIETQI